MIFTAGPAQVTCDRSGKVTSVRHRGFGDLSYVTGAGVGALQVDGAFLDVPDPEVLADVDEVEFVYTFPGRLRVVVRHSFSAGWGLRLAFSNLSGDVLQIDWAELALRSGAGVVAWALTLGASAAYSVSAASGTGPLLGARLRLGSVHRATERGLELSSFTLRPDGRYVVQLDWDWYAHPRDFTAARLSDAPSALFVTTGEAVQFRVDEDVAVVEPAGVEVERRQDRIDVVSHYAGTYPFELRSARGTTAFDLHWVDPVATTLAGLVPGALSGTRTAAGVAKLGGVAQALLVQHALAVGDVDDPDVAAEALDLFTARLGEPDTLTALEAAYLCREFDRTGDADLLTAATEALLATDEPSPGTGLAATQLCLGLILSGRPVHPVLAHLSRLVAEMDPDQAYAEWSVSRQSAALELVAVTHAGPGAAGVPASLPDLAPRIAGLGLHLGAGLRGRAVSPLPTDQLSHLITVFQLLPEGLSGDLRRRWGHSPQTLARLAAPELLARLEGVSVGDAHAWLLLAPQPS